MTDLDDELEYITVDSGEITSALTFYDKDIHIQSVSSILLQSILSGGINVSGTQDGDDIDQDETNHMWSKWIRDLMRCIWSIGFAASVGILNEYGHLEPRILPIEQIHVSFYKDDFGTIHFRYKKRLNPSSMAKKALTTTNGGMEEEYENVTTFVMNEPLLSGVLNSKIMSLLSDYLMEQHLIECSVIADRARAASVLVIEPTEKKFNPNEIQTASITGNVMLGDGTRSYQENNGLLKYEESITYEKLRQLNSHAYNTSIGIQKSQQQIKRLSHQPFNPTEIELKANQKLTRHVLPEAPDNLHIFREQRQARVFMAFGVPMNMSSDNRTKASAIGKASTSNNASSMEMFLNTQKELKQKLILWIKLQYKNMHYERALLNVFVTHQGKEKPNRSAIERSIAPTVTIDALPNDELSERLYVSGLLTFEGLVEMYSQKHSIPKHYFHTSPKISILQLNGVKPDETSQPKKKVKTKK